MHGVLISQHANELSGVCNLGNTDLTERDRSVTEHCRQTGCSARHTEYQVASDPNRSSPMTDFQQPAVG